MSDPFEQIPSRLLSLVDAHGLRWRGLAEALGVAPSTITHWIKHGRRPLAATGEAVAQWLAEQGVVRSVAARWEDPLPQPLPEEGRQAVVGDEPDHRFTTSPDPSEDADMLLRRQPIHQATRRHFGLTCDPFGRDLETHDDVFSGPDIAYVRESMWATARHGGLLAVVGESGSGKTTLLDDIEDRIHREGAPVVLIRPDVTGMETSDTRGRVLRVGHIQEAIIHGLAPDAPLRQSPQARADQLRRALVAAKESGQSVCVAFDEAHAMPIPTMKHLKRLLEIKVGFSRLLSIMLLGQPELGLRLSERNPEVREVVQRCEVVTLDPLDDQLDGYLAHKLRAAGRTLDDVIDRSGLDAMRERLGVASAAERARGTARMSRAYPLAAGNLLAAALNLACAAGAPRVTAGTVKGV